MCVCLLCRLHEFDEQVQWVREGMARVVPVPLLSLFTGYELETMVSIPAAGESMLRYSSVNCFEVHTQDSLLSIVNFSVDAFLPIYVGFRMQSPLIIKVKVKGL